MGKLFAGLALILLAVMVVIACVIQWTTGGIEPPTERYIATRPPEEWEDENAIIVTLGKGRKLAEPPENMLPTDLESVKPPDLPLAERETIDSDGYLPYTVQKGDTLTSIANHYLGKGTSWNVLQHHNPELADPHALREGAVIRIPLWKKGG